METADHATPADVLQALMQRYENYLHSQRGKPARGPCIDCDQPIPAHELCVSCPRCASLVCVRCLNTHPCGSA
jgi:hypothetical protein